jgi:hypothetical protein
MSLGGKVFEKGLYIIVGTIAISNLILFVLSVFYSTNLFNDLFEKILSMEGFS